MKKVIDFLKKITQNKFVYLIAYHSTSILSVLFLIIMFGLKTTRGKSVWATMNVYKGVTGACLACVILFCINLLVLFGGTCLAYIKKKRWAFTIPTIFQILFHIILLFLHIFFKIFKAGAICCLVFSMIFTLLSLGTLIIDRIFRVKNEGLVGIKSNEKKTPSWSKIIILVLTIGSTILSSLIFFIPLYTITTGLKDTNYILIKVLGTNSYQLEMPIIFMIMFLAVFGNFIYFLTIIPSYFSSSSLFLKKSKTVAFTNLVITLLFFITGFVLTFYFNVKSKTASTISFIPFLIMLIFLIIYSFVQGKFVKINAEEELEKDRRNKKFKIEPLVYIILLSLTTFLALFFNIVEVKFEAFKYKNDVKLSGINLLRTYGELGAGYQVLAFILFAFEFVSLTLLILSIVSFFGKYKDYYKVVKVTAFVNLIFMLILGLSGIYFKISQKINEENLLSLLESYNISFAIEYEYSIKSQTIYAFFISALIFIIMIARGQLNLHFEEDQYLSLAPNQKLPSTNSLGQTEQSNLVCFDPCPAFTELDGKKLGFEQDLNARKEQLFANLTLPNLVRFIVDYARESRLHLSYTLEDIATFVAGLGASRLSILQGMSGTGKTSLPKIFSEAILGNCEIVEVESSWRDKNELLGFYNEFSKCYTPKKFTQCLYKAKLNIEIPTFIVLDEMNLSRIEYYFSDFLSLMEHEEDKREIKLLNVKLERIEENGSYSYLCLEDGHTLKIPHNVWFVGTANRDESTFEISDKVYDRALTMNFNKRAPKIHSYSEELPQRFIPYEMLSNLLLEAKEKRKFDAESNEIIQKVEKLLLPYNISFGNRILKQMEDFVKIYCACFGDQEAVIKDAVERILLSKVVSKLEFKVVENKEKLAVQFDALGLSACSAFIRKLNED